MDYAERRDAKLFHQRGLRMLLLPASAPISRSSVIALCFNRFKQLAPHLKERSKFSHYFPLCQPFVTVFYFAAITLVKPV